LTIRKSTKINSKSATKNNETKKSSKMNLSAIKTLHKRQIMCMKKNKNKIRIKEHMIKDMTKEMIILISNAFKCSLKLNTLTKKWTRLIPKIKGSFLSIILVEVQAVLNLKTNRDGKTNLSNARITTTVKWITTTGTNDYKINKSTAKNTGNTTISNTAKITAKIDGKIIQARTLKTSATTRQTTRVKITIKTITCKGTDATSMVIRRNKCRICHLESLIQA